MRAIHIVAERGARIVEIDPPGPPAPSEVRVRIGAVALNHIDVWGWRGMAFARRRLPIVAGAEAAGTIEAVGSEVKGLKVGQVVSPYGARTCGICAACREGRDNFCEGQGTIGNIYGFHIDGFAQEVMNLPARLLVPAPSGIDPVVASLAGITFGTPEHMLFDNAKLCAGETVLIHAGGSGIGSAAIQLAKAAGARVITEDPERSGLNAQLEHALARLGQPEGGIAILHADLPLARVEHFAAFAASAPPAPSVTLVRSLDGGTNLMLLRPPGRFALAYGPGSYELHVEAAAAAGMTVTAFDRAELELDIDTPADLATFLATPGAGDTAAGILLRGLDLSR